MANPTDHLTAVRAALGLARKMTPGEYTMRRESFFVAIRAADLEELATTEQARGVDVANAAGFVALRNAAPAIAALADECERLRKESRTWFRGEAERQAARADALESALRAILDAPIGPEEHDAMTAASRLLGGK